MLRMLAVDAERVRGEHVIVGGGEVAGAFRPVLKAEEGEGVVGRWKTLSGEEVASTELRGLKF